MDSPVDNKRRKQAAAALLLALGLGAGVSYWISDNYDFRVVRRTADGMRAQTMSGEVAAAAAKPAPIVIRLACVDAEAALRGVKTPRGLREQLRGSDKSAPKPIPGKTCRPSANLPAADSTAAIAVAGGQ
jgi:hypothetical protein